MIEANYDWQMIVGLLGRDSSIKVSLTTFFFLNKIGDQYPSLVNLTCQNYI